MLEQPNQSEDPIKQNTIYTSHLLITVPLLEGEPGSAYKVRKRRSYTPYPHTTIMYFHRGATTILYLYSSHKLTHKVNITHAIMRPHNTTFQEEINLNSFRIDVTSTFIFSTALKMLTKFVREYFKTMVAQ